MPCRFASSGTVATSRSASRAILALNAASNFLRDLVISVLHRLRQSRTLHTLTFGPISGVHFSAGWIRFRASLMAMRRTSWIDQRINDGVALLLFLPWFVVAFFLAAADWHDGGSPPSWRRRASPGKRGDATHARICSRCDRARTRFSRSRNCPRSPTDGLRPPPAFRWMLPPGTKW